MHVVLDVIREVIKNAAMAVPVVRAWRMRWPRTSFHFSHCSADLDRFAFGPLRDLLPNLGNVNGLHALEVGPGDHLASGLALLAAGAASYTAIDRFPGDYKGQAAKAWYTGVWRAWPDKYPDLPWPNWLKPETFPEAYSARVRILPVAIEDADGIGCYDVVYSHLVAEHVSDITAFASVTARLLRPGGVSVHLVDFGPHGRWARYPDPLTFLCFPDWLWWLMGSNRGVSNRRRFHEFYAAFKAAGLKADVSDRKMLPEGIDHTKLARRFRGMPVDSLATLMARFVCRRPL